MWINQCIMELHLNGVNGQDRTGQDRIGQEWTGMDGIGKDWNPVSRLAYRVL